MEPKKIAASGPFVARRGYSRRDFLKIGGASLAGAALLGTAACGGGGGSGGENGGENIRLTLGSGHPAGGAITYTTWVQEFFVPEFKKRVEEETDYRVEINEAYGGSIAQLAEVLEATQDGVLDIGIVTYPFDPSKLFLQNLSYYVPFQSPDMGIVMRATRKAFDDNPKLKTELEDKYNQKLFALAGWGNYNLLTTFDWNEVEELQGRKISAAGPNLPWLEPVGAVPVQTDLNEAYTSMQTGVYDGLIMFPKSVAGFKLYEPASYYTLTDFGAVAAAGIHVNLDTWNSLPDEVKTIFQEVAVEYEETLPEQVNKQNQDALNTMRQAGTTIKEADPEVRQAWADALPNIPNQRAQEANEKGMPGSKALSDYIEAQKQEGYTFPREWDVK